MMGHLIWISPTEQAKGKSGKEPKNSIKWPDGVLKLHQIQLHQNLGPVLLWRLWTRGQIYSSVAHRLFIIVVKMLIYYKYRVSLCLVQYSQSQSWEKSADLTVVQKTIFDTTKFHGWKGVDWSMFMEIWLEGKSVAGKGAQTSGMTAVIRRLSSEADSRTWKSFTRSGLKLESVHQEPARTPFFWKLASTSHISITKPLLN